MVNNENFRLQSNNGKNASTGLWRYSAKSILRVTPRLVERVILRDSLQNEDLNLYLDIITAGWAKRYFLESLYGHWYKRLTLMAPQKSDLLGYGGIAKATYLLYASASRHHHASESRKLRLPVSRTFVLNHRKQPDGLLRAHQH